MSQKPVPCPQCGHNSIQAVIEERSQYDIKAYDDGSVVYTNRDPLTSTTESAVRELSCANPSCNWFTFYDIDEDGGIATLLAEWS